MTKIIGVDLDEVLAEFVDYALEHHDYNINGQTIKREYIKDYYIHKLVGFDMTLEDAIDWFRDAMKADIEDLQVKPILGAYEELEKHKKMGYNFKIVTARNGDLFGEYTSKWIKKHYPGIFDEIVFANHFSKEEQSKANICKEHNIFHMVEDNIDYALDLALNGIETFLLEKPWNINRKEEHQNLIKVKTWDEIYF